MNENIIEIGRKNAAQKAVKENLKEGLILGVGSGSTIIELES